MHIKSSKQIVLSDDVVLELADKMLNRKVVEMIEEMCFQHYKEGFREGWTVGKTGKEATIKPVFDSKMAK